MEYKEIKDVPRNAILKFLESLNVELKTFRDFWTDDSGNRTWRVLQPESHGIVALYKGRVFGVRYWFTLPEYPNTTGITGVVVKKEYWEQGINQTLLKLTIEMAKKHGLKKFISGIDRENMASLWCALKSGYRIVSVNVEAKRYNLEMDLTEGDKHGS